MACNQGISLRDYLLLISLFVAVFGLWATFWQIRKNNKHKRAEYVTDLCNQWATNKEMRDIFYNIEYGQYAYQGPNGGEAEKKLDMLLHFFDNMARLYKLGVIDIADLKFIGYEFVRTYENEGVQNYFEFLDEWCSENNINKKNHPFFYFREIGELLANVIRII